jgi:hypothetical protein
MDELVALRGGFHPVALGAVDAVVDGVDAEGCAALGFSLARGVLMILARTLDVYSALFDSDLDAVAERLGKAAEDRLRTRGAKVASLDARTVL